MDKNNQDEMKDCPNCGNSILLSDIECPICGQKQEITQRMINDSFVHPEDYGKDFKNAKSLKDKEDPNFHEMNRSWATGLFFIGLLLLIASYFSFGLPLLIPLIIGVYIQTHSHYLHAEGMLLWIGSIISMFIMASYYI